MGIVGGRAERGQTTEVVEIEAFDQARAVSALRTHQHERFVGRHPEEPGRKTRIASKRCEAADDLQKGRLQEVPPVFVGHGIAHELSLDVGPYPHDELFEGSLFAGLRSSDQVRLARHGRGRNCN